ncbi:PQQ-dependent sugar dehydrogenase [Hymenobacter sp. BT188]|uniref:PQQ-dependent sugar dehydrogenase n=1 Tax=Hymenobacter sp. BT188 TaxID=2763504 RepID=UPI0016517125|nr:PQQ-dependent sugar dehydrogenase [Hymenobacter sp. BT188]MBC6606229.1 PQQ-dependent sugar dehydrogenase [Hymenobacter sp. BT188]
MKTFAASLLLVSSLLTTAVSAQTITFPVGSTTISATPLATGLDIPWELVWGPDDFIWMTERGGRISRVNPTTGQVLPLLNVPDVAPTGESGLLGMVLHPDFATTSPYLYIVYNYNDNGLKEKVVRYTYNAATTSLSAPLVLLGNIISTTTHSGSRLLILPDRTLLMTTGDAQLRSDSQNPASLNGKILRMNLDGSIPSDNPTSGSRVYTLGHRNAQGLVRLPSGRIYSSEHGENSDDELNLIESGRNYGWPNVPGKCDQTDETAFCAANNVRQPLFIWTPTLAVAGLTYYDSPAIPEWRGSLLMATLKASRLVQLPLNAAGDAISTITPSEFLINRYGRLRALCVSPAGRVYVATSNGSGNDQIVTLENRGFVLSTKSEARNAALGLWPNPARQTVAVRLPTAPTSATSATIHDALGRVVRTAKFAPQQAELNLSLAGLRAGVYVVQVRNATEQYARRLIIE